MIDILELQQNKKGPLETLLQRTLCFWDTIYLV